VPRLILLLAIGTIAYIVYQRLKSLPPEKRKAAYIKFGLGGLFVVLVILTAMGRMHWLGAAITGLVVGASRLLPSLMRLSPVLQWLHRQKSEQANNQQSRVETSLLRMELDHASGNLNGEVLQGEHQGRKLDDLETGQLEELLAWCQQRDVDSARLLESYMQRRFGESWQGPQTPPPTQNGSINRAEALAILGLEDGADKEAIVSSHRHLMQKLHPDRGGTDYLAAKLNQAKDFLLG
jgi:hypothetical protein